MTNNEILEAAQISKANQARTSLMDFVLYTKPDYEAGWFNELLCAELEQFMKDVEDGKSPRLMIFAPPRSGKSEIASRRFPAFVFGHHPDWSIIGCSYSSDLANMMSRDAQRIIDDPKYNDVFPETCLNASNVRTMTKSGVRTVEKWELMSKEGDLHGGSYRAAGVEGGITGQGMNIGIIDDPAKDYKQASSSTYQASVMDWYDTTFFTRRDPKINGIIIILTRWHELDLAGQLLKRAATSGERFRVMSFPMEAEKEEIHELSGKKYKLRDVGDILFPERMPKDFVEACKRSGSLTWNALYQQRPTSKGGQVIRSDWFKYYTILPKLIWCGIYADTAQKKGEENDNTVLELWGITTDGDAVLIDLVYGKYEAWQLEQVAPAFWAKHINKVTSLRHLAIEDKVSGTGLIQKLQRDNRIPIKPIPRTGASGSKASRVMDIQGYIQSGYVYLPDPSVSHIYDDGSVQTDCSYLNEFLSECESFTMEMTHSHDDFIDPMCDALSDMLITKKDLSFHEAYSIYKTAKPIFGKDKADEVKRRNETKKRRFC